MKYLFILLFVTSFFLISCSTTPTAVVEIPATPISSNIVSKESLGPVTEEAKIKINVVDYNEPAETGNTDNGAPVDSSTLVTKNNTQYTIAPTKDDFKGGAVVYNFVPNHIYKIFLAPYKLVDIQLEPGEQIVSPPACGDTANFVLGTSDSFEKGVRCEHIYLKAVYANKETTLSINTDKRVYQFSLYSYTSLFMPIVSFNYPIDSFERMKEAAAIQQRNSIYLSGSITDFNFSYDIVPMSIHRPKWCPSLVFDDGKKCYLQFASATRAAAAPVLFIIEGNKRILCNYRVVGDYYIVDQVFEHAELVLDVDMGNIITIKKKV